MRKWFMSLAPAAALLSLAGCATMGGMEKMEGTDDMGSKSSMEGEAMSEAMAASFTVRVEVLDGSVTPIAPIAWTVTSGDTPLFAPGTAVRIDGLESLAEDGDPAAMARVLKASMEVSDSGVASMPEGSMAPGPATPGRAYSFEFSAREGQRLVFASMFVQSNDLFFAPAGMGLDLFSMGKPISGDVTSKILLYDAGTEVNERPGSGSHQAPRQMGRNSGDDEMGTVRPITDVSDGYMYPAVGRLIRVSVSAM